MGAAAPLSSPAQPAAGRALWAAGAAALLACGCLTSPPSQDKDTDTTESDGAAPSDTPAPDAAVSFSAQIVPIFREHCVVCHDAGRTADRVGISMRLNPDEAYESIVDQGSSQSRDWRRVVPGDPDGSLLYLKVSSEEPPVGLRMPLACAALTNAEIEAIRAWIAQGALDN